MKQPTALALALGLAVYSTAVWAQQQPPAAGQAQLDPETQMLGDALQNLATVSTVASIVRNAIIAYDRKMAQAVAERNGQITWWQTCAKEKACWDWLAPSEGKP